MSSEIEKFSKSQKPSKNLMHPASAADHFSLYEEGTSSEPLQYGLLWDYGFGRTHFPAGGADPGEPRHFLPACPPPPRPRPASLPSPPSPRGRRGALSVRRRAAQDSTAEGRGFSFVDQPDATDQQNKPPCSVFMKPRKIEKYFAGDLSPLSERKGSMLTNRQ